MTILDGSLVGFPQSSKLAIRLTRLPFFQSFCDAAVLPIQFCCYLFRPGNSQPIPGVEVTYRFELQGFQLDF